MAENSKNDLLLSELSSIETQVSSLTQKFKDQVKRNRELEDNLVATKNQNENLNKKIISLQNEIENFKNGSALFALEERETIKNRLQSLISKLDYHLSS